VKKHVRYVILDDSPVTSGDVTEAAHLAEIVVLHPISITQLLLDVTYATTYHPCLALASSGIPRKLVPSVSGNRSLPRTN